MKTKIALWVIVLLLAMQLVLAIGIRPAKTEIISDNFAENEIKLDGILWVVNNEHRDFSVDVYVDGDMADFVKVKQKKLTFLSHEESKEIEFEVKIKKDQIPPGSTIANIAVEEKLESADPNVISSKLILKHKINFIGPYPDKYIVADINFHERNDQIEFVSEVKNLGKQDLQEVQTKFYVNNKEQVQELKTDATALKRKETKLLQSQLPRNEFTVGEYDVAAITTYDDLQVELHETLVLGSPQVEISYFDKYFIANKVNQYTLDLLNKWNKIIPNVYVDVVVLKEGAEVDNFRTRTVDIEAEMVKRVSDYLNAEDKGPGKYTFEMTVNFWNLVRMDDQKYTFESTFVTEEDARRLNLAPPSLTGAASWNSGNLVIIAPWLLVGILVSIISMYIFWRYRHRDQYE